MKKKYISFFSALTVSLLFCNIVLAQTVTAPVTYDESGVIQNTDASILVADKNFLNSNNSESAIIASTTIPTNKTSKTSILLIIAVIVIILAAIIYIKREFLKKLIMKRAIKSQMKGVPQAQQDMMLVAIEKNPKFFENIAKEIKQKEKEGKGKTAASMEVMRKHQDELRKLMM